MILPFVYLKRHIIRSCDYLEITVKHQLFACWENFPAFLSSADFFQKSTFSKNSVRNTIGVSNNLDPDQARQNVGPDLGPNCLQRLSAVNTSM